MDAGVVNVYSLPPVPNVYNQVLREVINLPRVKRIVREVAALLE